MLVKGAPGGTNMYHWTFVTIGSNNIHSPIWHQAIIPTSADYGTNYI